MNRLNPLGGALIGLGSLAALLVTVAAYLDAADPEKDLAAAPPTGFALYYHAHVTSVYDGDTITCRTQLGRHLSIANDKIRLYGLNAPETNEPGGKAARDWLRKRITGYPVVLQAIENDKAGKYGRLIAIVWLQEGNRWKNINRELIETGHAVPKQY